MTTRSAEIAIRTQPFYVEADRDNRKIVQSRPRTDIAYYKQDRAVSSTNYDGVLPVDGSVEIQKGTWFVSPTKARVRVTPQPAVQEQRRFNSLLMWGHSWSVYAAGGDFPFTHHVPKVAVNLLGCERIESRSVGGSAWTDNKLRDAKGIAETTQGASWVDMFRYLTPRLHNWPISFTAGADASAYMFMHGQNEYHWYGPGKTAPFVNTSQAAIHLALARNSWIQSTDASVVALTGGNTYWSTVSGAAGTTEAKVDRNTGADTLAITGDSVKRLQLPYWNRFYTGPEGTRTVGVTFIIDPLTSGTVTLTNGSTTVGPVSLDATTELRPITGTYPTQLPLPKVVRVPNCAPGSTIDITITGVTGKVQIDAAGIEPDRNDPGAPTCIWEIQPKIDLYAPYAAPFQADDALYDEFARALKLMLQEFPQELVKMVDHENCHLIDTLSGVAHPDGVGHDRMTLNIRDVVAPGLSDFAALRPPAGDDEWRAFGTSSDGYVDPHQANVFDIVPPAGFRKRLNGVIELRGVVGRAAAPVGGDVLATLPQGFRPARLWSYAQAAVGLPASGTAHLRINADTGVISYVSHLEGTAAANDQFYLDGIMFDGQT